MAKETIVRDSPVADALRKLKEEETELLAKVKPIQEAIAALEKIVDKSAKKPKQATLKETSASAEAEETFQEAEVES